MQVYQGTFLLCDCRYFSVKEAYEEGLVDKLIPGYNLNRSVRLWLEGVVSSLVMETSC
jgi:hypothetical protein